MLHVLPGVASDNRFGGVPVAAQSIAEAQVRQGDSVALVSPFVGERPAKLGRASSHFYRGANLNPRGGYGFIFSVQTLIALPRFIAEADVVHIHLCRDATVVLALILALVARKRTIIQTHGMMDSPTNQLGRAIDRLAITPLLKHVRTAITLTTDENRHIISASHGRCKPRHLDNGVSIPGSVLGREERRQEILSLGRIHKRKSIGTLLWAAAELRTLRGPAVPVRIVGPDDGDLMQIEALRSNLRLYDTVRIDGPVAHKQGLDLSASSMIFVLTAPAEPFGLSLVEAMAAGTPVIVHESSALAVLVRDSCAGLTFDGTPAQLAANISLLLTQPDTWESCSRNARHLAISMYDIDRVVRELDSIYSTL